jgi:hypothetical protein
MDTKFTQEQVLALAPDSGSAKSGRELASERKWVSFAKTQGAIWGECQGSGKLPYQAQIELAEPAFKCSCPSRKFPCKHGLGLLLLYAADAAAFKEAEPPVWVQEWLAGRAKKAQVKAEKAAQPKEMDEAAQAKRTAAREKKVVKGLEELDLWLRDLVRGGLAQAPNKPYRFWDDMGARLVDAQAPGLARMVRELGQHTSGQGWQERLLEGLGCIHLLVQGYGRLDTLPEALRADVRTAIGFNQPQEEVRALPGVAGMWLVMGQAVVQEDKLKTRRTWLCLENTRQYALLLEFAYGLAAFSVPLSQHDAWEGELAFFPSNFSMRAVLKEGKVPDNYGLATIAGGSAQDLLQSYAAALAANPWTERIPTEITAIVEPHGDTEHWTLRSLDGRQFRLHPAFSFHHGMLGDSGGHPLHFFGEWDGQVFLPLRAYSQIEETLFHLPHKEGMA